MNTALANIVGFFLIPLQIPTPLDIPNPLKNVQPSLGPFAPVLESKIAMLLALIWFVCICIGVAFLLTGIVNAVAAVKRRDPNGVSDGAFAIAVPAGGLIFLSLAAVFVGALL